MYTLGVILARAGSKGLPDKCLRPLLGRALIEYTFDHVLAARRLDAKLLTTDSLPAGELARRYGIDVVDRPPALASDTATVDAAARHAIERFEQRRRKSVEAVALLYGNIPVRADGLIDRAIRILERTGCDSVRSVAPVGKHHPDWMFRLAPPDAPAERSPAGGSGDGCALEHYRTNSIHRRQDLEPLYELDGAVCVVRRAALFAAEQTPDDRQSFLGRDRRALVQAAGDAVDVDEPFDLLLAEARLREKHLGEFAAGGRPHGMRAPAEARPVMSQR